MLSYTYSEDQRHNRVSNKIPGKFLNLPVETCRDYTASFIVGLKEQVSCVSGFGEIIF